MKSRLIFLLIAACCAMQPVNAQIIDPPNGALTNPTNTNCNAAERLCMGTIERTYNFSKDYGPCMGQVTKLFYTFKTSNDVGISLANMTTSAASTYKVYGPYESHLQGCEQLNEVPTVVATGGPSSSHTINFPYLNQKVYILEVSVTGCVGTIQIYPTRVADCSTSISCTDCIKGFQPGPGKYVVSGWVKEESAAAIKTSYTHPSIIASCPSVGGTCGACETFIPSGQIIDGWQRIEGIYTVPQGATDFRLELKNGAQTGEGYVLFDDVRIFPFDGSMVSYVYDPLTLRLAAELDERNYAKLYEYDEEGKLVRVKKETEKGIMTIQENRENSVKQ